MKPDATSHNPAPQYLRGLLKVAGLTQEQAARQIGIATRTMRLYLASREAKHHAPAPYPVQFALEALAGTARKHAPSRKTAAPIHEGASR